MLQVDHLSGLIGKHFYERSYLRILTRKQLEKQSSLDLLPQGLPRKNEKIALDCITKETTMVTALSTAAGMPGGAAMFATVPADVAQYFGHVLTIIQKLAYLYDWPSILNDSKSIDDGTQNLLIVFIGVMLGVNGATAAIAKVSEAIAKNTTTKLAEMALTKGMVYPTVKQIAKTIGVKMTKKYLQVMWEKQFRLQVA